MSLDKLSYAEEWYYLHDICYRQELRETLKLLGLALRLPTDGELHDGIDAFVMSRGLATGHVPTRKRRRWRKSDEEYFRELEETYA